MAFLTESKNSSNNKDHSLGMGRMFSSLDYTTLLVSYALVRVLQAAGLVYVWRVHRKFAPLRELALGSVLVAAGTLLASGPSALPADMWAAIRSAFILGGIAIFDVGLARLADRPPPWIAASVAVSVALAGKLSFALIWPSAAAGVVVFTIFGAVCDGYAAIALIRTPPGPFRLTQRLISGLLFLEITATVARGLALTAGLREDGLEARLGAVVHSGPEQSFFLLVLIGTAFLLSLAIAVLTNQRLQMALDRAANIDPLTGLLNRRAFAEIADLDWARSVRSGRELSVLLVDVDHFKNFNDSCGHAMGDAVLVLVSETLTRETRRADAVCRFGGEEFLILMPDTSAAEAELLAERLRRAVADLSLPGAPNLAITASIGLATRARGYTNWEQLVAASDRALYEAKKSGRNRVVVDPQYRDAA